MKKTSLALIATALLLGMTGAAQAETKKIILIAGKASHARGDHEHNAGQLLFQKCLAATPGVSATVISGGWPTNESVLDDAAAIVIYSDGGAGHPFLQGERLKKISSLHAKGVGIACIHYAVEPTKEKGQGEFLQWIGGCFEVDWSVNPFWEANFEKLPVHPITRGVRPFKIEDEWYYHMRFVPDMMGVTPILTAMPPADTLERPDGPHSGNPAVRKAVAAGEPQIVGWAFENKSGTRGFGFTGGHFHKNWGDDNLRKLLLNAILWTAKVEVPAGGVKSEVSKADLVANQDAKGSQKK